MEQLCKICGQPGEYYRDKKGHRVSASCKKCYNSRVKRRYHDPKSGAKAKKLKNSQAHKETAHQFVREYLESNPCVDCGEPDLRVLQFDHRDRSSKKMAIGNMISSSYGLKHIKAEIKKCDVRCANCHIKRTATQLGWWRADV